MTLGTRQGELAMKQVLRRASVAAVLAFASACSSSRTGEGFISLGRDTGEGGIGAVGAIGSSPGARSSGGVPTGGAFPTGGTGKGGTSTGGTGGTIVPQGGTTGANGGTAGDGNDGLAGEDSGGTTGTNGGSGGDGPLCGSVAMPFYPSDPYERDSSIEEACDRAGPNERVCLADDTVWYCGGNVGGIAEKDCPPGTCVTGCCHAASDPCPEDDPDAYDCAGDCGGYGLCMDAPSIPVWLAPNFVQVTRVGSNMAGELQCGDRTRRYFALSLEFTRLQAGPAARVTVSPPWTVSAGIYCDVSPAQCLVTNGPMGFAVVSTDVESPPPRNVMIETSDLGSTCP